MSGLVPLAFATYMIRDLTIMPDIVPLQVADRQHLCYIDYFFRWHVSRRERRRHRESGLQHGDQPADELLKDYFDSRWDEPQAPR